MTGWGVYNNMLDTELTRNPEYTILLGIAIFLVMRKERGQVFSQIIEMTYEGVLRQRVA